jgi:hypothetical protein
VSIGAGNTMNDPLTAKSADDQFSDDDGDEAVREGEYAVCYEPSIDGEEERYYLDRVDRLAKHEHADILWPHGVFIQSAAAQPSTIKKGDFHPRFREFLKGLNPNAEEVPANILDGLFQLAVAAEKKHLAWIKTVEALKSEKFWRSLEYARATVRIFARNRKSRRFPGTRAPEWMSSWERLWIEAFDQLEESILAQLRGAERSLEGLRPFAKLGRSDMVSHILTSFRSSIEEAIAHTPLSKTPLVALAAFAHASRLLPLRDDANDAIGRYINNIKARLSRAEGSKEKVKIFAFFIRS